MSRITLAVAGVLAIVCAAPVFAEVVDLQPVTPIRRVEPVVLGYATEVGTHTLRVDVPRAEAMTFEFDSRTVMPRELQTGTPVRIDFRILDNGMHFANRVTPILPGSNDWRTIEDMRTSQMMTTEPTSQTVVTEQTTVMDPVTTQTTTTTTATDVTTTTPVETDATPATTDDNVLVTGEPDAADRLPQTASELPLLLTLGAASIAGAIALSIRRRRNI